MLYFANILGIHVQPGSSSCNKGTGNANSFPL